MFTERWELNCYALLTVLVSVQFWSVAMPGRSVVTPITRSFEAVVPPVTLPQPAPANTNTALVNWNCILEFYYQITAWPRVLFRSWWSLTSSSNSTPVEDPKSSVPYSQEPIAGPLLRPLFVFSSHLILNFLRHLSSGSAPKCCVHL